MPNKLPFRVIHVSGQDESFKAAELNHHHPSSKGWQSAKFCLFPQDIVIHLDQRARMRKIQILSHQYLIATKIEFFIGDVPESVPLSLQNARYTRLGYVALSDNEKTHFRARELKSVHVDAIGMFLKLVVHKNYINKHNLYNQVGLIAINVIGDDLRSTYEIGNPDEIDIDRSEYISPLEDLAFDMYQDPEVAEVIRRLEKKKHSAVLDERFDYAKRLRDAITYLQQVGEKLGKLDVEKRQAIENEDYERAKLKKIQIDEHRLRVFRELNVSSLLGDVEERAPEPAPARDTPRYNRTKLDPLNHKPEPGTPPPKKGIRVKPLETIYDNEAYSPAPLPLPAASTPPPVTTPRQRQSPRAYDPEDRPLPALRAKPSARTDVEETARGDEIGDPEHMSERDMRQAASVIDVFGLPLVAKAYSKSWSHREDALLEVYKRINELPPDSDKDEVKAMFRAAIFLIQKGVKDKVFAVFRAALTLNKLVLVDFSERHQVPRPDLHYAIDKVVPSLLSRTGETAVRIRDLAKEYTIDMSTWQQVWNFQSLYNECLKPIVVTSMDRLALSRMELVMALYKRHGLGHHHFNLESLMQFASQALQHRAGEVRESAELLIVNLYETHDRETVRKFLPPDDYSTRKNPLYKRLFDKFDRLDGKVTGGDPGDTPRQKKQREIEKLQSDLQELRDLTAAKARGEDISSNQPPPVSKGAVSSVAGSTGPASVRSKAASKSSSAVENQEDPTTTFDNSCIFCGETNETFTEEGLDKHYWMSCPMLRRCANCTQVVEIATLVDHLLEECESQAQFSKCPQCCEAFPSAKLEEHVLEGACEPCGEGSSRCPLCHTNIPMGEESWHNHLMGQQGCPQNPRRLTQNKETPAAPATTANKPASTVPRKSQLPQPKTRGGTK